MLGKGFLAAARDYLVTDSLTGRTIAALCLLHVLGARSVMPMPCSHVTCRAVDELLKLVVAAEPPRAPRRGRVPGSARSRATQQCHLGSRFCFATLSRPALLGEELGGEGGHWGRALAQRPPLLPGGFHCSQLFSELATASPR